VSTNAPVNEGEAARAAVVDEEFHLSEWLELLRRRRKLLYLVAGGVLGLALVLYVVSPRVYRSTAVLQIERQTPSVVAVEELLGAETSVDAQSFYPTQYELLKGRGLAERVVRNLRLADDPVFNPKRGSLMPVGPAQASTGMDDEAALGALARRLIAGLEVQPVRNTRLVKISYTSRSRELAALVANGVAQNYIEWKSETRYATVGQVSSFLASQIEAVKREIQDKEAQLQAYGRRTDILTLDPASNVTLQRLEALNRDYIAAVSHRINAEARYKELVSTPAESLADTMSGGLVAQLRADQAKLEREYANKLATYKPEWPAMQELRAQIDKGQQNLDAVIQETVSKARDQARTEYQTEQRREQSLTAELARQKSEAMTLNAAAIEYNNLKVEVSTRRSLLDDLVRKQSETEVASRLKGTRESNIVVVERALVPGDPYRPSLRRNLALGLVLGLGLGIGAVFMSEYLDRTFKIAEDVERVLALPVLAVIPEIGDGVGQGYSYRYGYGYGRKRKPKPHKRRKPAAEPAVEQPKIELVPHEHPKLTVSEAYRSLRTSLMLSSAEELRAVLITSAIPGEGKTATAANLAVVLAQLGHEVLLVDADLRKPRLHEVFGVSNRTGLVNVLTGSEEPAAVLTRTRVPGLWLTVSGPTPPTPAELLASQRMRDFVALVKTRFDYVVFDSPPALPVTDATVLGSILDGVIVCIAAGQVVREDAAACLNRLDRAELKVRGAVFNRFRQMSSRYYYDRYRYYDQYATEIGGGAEKQA
jgi:capsular exopolysaccharide synthesis family protein